MSVSPVPAPPLGFPTITGLSPESQLAAIRRLSHDELLRSLLQAHAQEQHCVVVVLIHLIEAQRRRVHRYTGCSSLYDYCQRKLSMSKAEACWRIRAARTCKRFPFVLELLATGRLTLTAIAMLAPHVVSTNVHELTDAACKLSIHELKRMLAERFPKPEQPTVIRRLVQAFATHPVTAEGEGTEAGAQWACPPEGAPGSPPSPARPLPTDEQADANTMHSTAIAPDLVPECKGTVTQVFSKTIDPANSSENREAMVPLHDDRAASTTDSLTERTLTAAATHIAHHILAKLGAAGVTSVPDAILFEAVSDAMAHAVRVEAEHALAAQDTRMTLSQLATDRWCWQVTVDQETQDLLEEALCYADSVASDHALRQTLKAALGVYVAERRRKKFAQVSRPRSAVPESGHQPSEHTSAGSPEHEHGTHENSTQPPAIQQRDRLSSGVRTPAPPTAQPPPHTRSRHIPAHVKRAVYARDGGRCTFVSADGTRCDERRDLQFDHRKPFACGGEATVENTRLLCAPHNQLEAERAFGEAHVQERIQAARSRTRVTRSP